MIFLSRSLAHNEELSKAHDALGLAQRAQELARMREAQSLVPRHKSEQIAFDPVPLHLLQEDWQVIEDYLIGRLVPVADKLRQNSGFLDGFSPEQIARLQTHYVPELAQLKQDNSAYLFNVDVQIAQSGQLLIKGITADAPMYLGDLLQHRLLLRNLNSESFVQGNVQRLVSFFDQWRTSINELSTSNTDTNIVVLLDPAQSESYGQYTYLANYLGYSVVHTADLTVRDAKVWLKTLSGLVSVDVILNWTTTELLDPLELPQADINGIIGLNQAVRQGQVTISNPLNSALLQLLVEPEEPQALQAIPFWHAQESVVAPVTLRCFVLVRPDMVSVLPSARAFCDDARLGHKDVWVEQSNQWFMQDVISQQWQSGNHVLGEHILTSRTAENLFWFGCYIERAENLIRFMRSYAEHIIEMPISGSIALQQALSFMHQAYRDKQITYPYIVTGKQPQYQTLNEYKSALIDMFKGTQNSSIKQILEQIFFCTGQIHDLLVTDGHRTLALLRDYHRVLNQYSSTTPVADMQSGLDQIMSQLMALRGAIHDTLTDQNGAFMLNMGHAIGRSELINAHLTTWLNNDLDADEQTQHLPTLLKTHVSMVTYKRRNRLNMSVSQTIDLLLCDSQYPRSLSYQIDQLLKLVPALPKMDGDNQQHILALLWQLKAQCHTYSAEQLASQVGNERVYLREQMNFIKGTLARVIDSLQVQYFSHTELADTRHRQGYVGTERDLL